MSPPKIFMWKTADFMDKTCTSKTANAGVEVGDITLQTVTYVNIGEQLIAPGISQILNTTD